jgi:hypothetical protein
MRRTWLFCAILALSPLLGLGIWRAGRAQADRAGPAPAEAARSKLPLTQVVLFNTGLGWFQREGAVEGDARVELSIPASSINDMLKTLLVDNGGKPAAVSYDGAEPIDQALGAFTINLASNPTLGQLLNQARGEKVEVALEGSGGGLAGPLSGTIVGMEAEFENQTREVHFLNLQCSDGVRRLPLARVQRVRFLNAGVEEEFQRALAVLASGRSEQRRLVSLRLDGAGRRKVKVGHVAETPIWKACYRLVLDGKDNKPVLQCWAVIQNTTEEDWRDVRVVLVSGRPITFEMDLGQPLFMPRPKVEPAVYASLRPPVSQSAMPGTEKQGKGQVGGQNFGGGGGNFGVGGGNFGGGNFGMTPGMSGSMQAGLPLGGPGGSINRYQPVPGTTSTPRLTYEELAARREQKLRNRRQGRAQARAVGSSLLAGGEGIDDVFTTAATIGEGFSHVLQSRVHLARQKSALLPVHDGPIELKPLSVYNPAVHPRFPLQAVRLKNTTGQHLMQGPVAVYDGGAYVGDSRMLDLGPTQDRLLSYAVDLGLEVRPEVVQSTDGVTSMEVARGTLWVVRRYSRHTTYRVVNRSKSDRTLMVEHPRSNWLLAADSAKPVESTRDLHRFEWQVAAGKTARHAVVETQEQTITGNLATDSDQEIRQAMRERRASKPVQEALGKVLAMRHRLVELHGAVVNLGDQLRAIHTDQERLRANLDKVPKESPTQKRYLQKLDQQETQIEKLQAQLAEKQATEAKERREQETYLKGTSVK